METFPNCARKIIENQKMATLKAGIIIIKGKKLINQATFPKEQNMATSYPWKF